MPQPFANAVDAAVYATAGAAIITLKSKKTDARFTYRIQAPRKDNGAINRAADRLFVKLLTGPQNTEDYTYLGQIRAKKFELTRASRATANAPAVKAISYFVAQVVDHGKLPDALEVWHEGACGRCGRPLTVPESVERGIGPECIKHVH